MAMFDARAVNGDTGRQLIDEAVNGVNLVLLAQLELRVLRAHRGSSQMQILGRISVRDAAAPCTAQAEDIVARVQQVRLLTMLAPRACVRQSRIIAHYMERFNALSKISSETPRAKSQRHVCRAII